MKHKHFHYYIFILLACCVSLSPPSVSAQQTLLLRGTGSQDAYAAINDKLAEDGNAIEVSDCSHPQFGSHITQAFDEILKKHVFRFHIHRDHDTDRCKKFDRQRTEIKVYDKSPDWLKGVENSKFTYKWKFRLDRNFQPSRHFTHWFQMKAVGGPYSSHPMITFTARKRHGERPDRFELRYGTQHDSSKLMEANLPLFLGRWLQVSVNARFGEKGALAIRITSINTGAQLLHYENNSIKLWKDSADFLRPKWGIYRSLKHKGALRDEVVDFADIEIQTN